MKFSRFFICLLICLGGGWLSGLFTNAESLQWYLDLVKSLLTPPNFVFPIVWSILYILMSISLYLVWTSKVKNKGTALFLFFLQLFFNFIWSFIFFYHQSPGIALIDAACLWGTILATMIFFFRFSKWSSYLMVPYILWVSLAFYFNLFIWIHN